MLSIVILGCKKNVYKTFIDRKIFVDTFFFFTFKVLKRKHKMILLVIRDANKKLNP